MNWVIKVTYLITRNVKEYTFSIPVVDNITLSDKDLTYLHPWNVTQPSSYDSSSYHCLSLYIHQPIYNFLLPYTTYYPHIYSS